MSDPSGSSGSPSVHFLEDDEGRIGAIVIDSTIRGRARGGLRMLPDVSVGELADAARSMTLKYGLLSLPQGGAKAGVLGDPEAPPARRRHLLERFARAAGPWPARRVGRGEGDESRESPLLPFSLKHGDRSRSLTSRGVGRSREGYKSVPPPYVTSPGASV